MNWAMLIDVGILALLGVTIFYAAKLSIYLKTFHDGKKDMGFLIQDLSASVARAEHAINAMQDSAAKSGQKLQDVINEGKFISDELRFMAESGNSLADRLEKLADRNRDLVVQIEESGGIGHGNPALSDIPNDLRLKPTATARKYAKAPIVNPSASNAVVHKNTENAFFIRDTELGLVEDDDMMDDGDFDFADEDAYSFASDDGLPSSYGDAGQDKPALKSQAEQDLYNALRRRKRGSAAHGNHSGANTHSRQKKILGNVT